MGGAPGEAEIRAAMLAAARGMVGWRWRHQGRTERGVDCVGLVMLSARAAGFTVEEVTGYSRRALGAGFLEHFRPRMRGVTLPEGRPGDVLVFTETVYPCHCGVLADGPAGAMVIHADGRRGRVIEEPLAGDLRRRLAFVFRLPLEELTGFPINREFPGKSGFIEKAEPA